MKSKNLISTFCTESDVYFVPGNEDAIKKAKKFKPKKYKSNTDNIIDHLEEYINNI